MLFSYDSSDRYWYIQRNEPNGVAFAASGAPSKRWIRKYHCFPFNHHKTWKTSKASGQQQTAIGRVRCAVARMFPGLDHAVVGAIAKQVLKCARHVRLDRDNPETHLAFSPGGVKAFDFKRRRSLTFAKFIRRKCSHLFTNRLSVTDAMLDKGSQAFRLSPELSFTPRIVTGEDAYNIYLGTDYEPISSCMSGSEHKARYVEHHFRANPKTIQLVIATKGSKLALRAKLWRNENGSHYLDRIYANNEFTGIEFQDLEESVRSWLVNRGYTLADTYDVIATHVLGEYMPYLDKVDTFDRLDDERIHLHPDGEYQAGSTDGEDPSDDSSGRYHCCCCNCRVDEDNMRSPEYSDSVYCEDCYSDRFTWDEYSECDIDADDAVCAYRIRRGQRIEIYTHRDNTTETYDGETYLTDDVVELHNGDYAGSDDENLVELHDGDYALLDDTVYLELSDEYALSDDEDVIQLASGEYCWQSDAIDIDGEWYLPEDVMEITDDYGNVTYIAPIRPASNQLCLAFE